MARPRGHRLNRSAFSDLLNLHGLSIADVHKRSGVPQPTIRSLTGGFHRASVPMAHKIALALDCQPQTLFPTLGAGFLAVDTEDEEGVA